MAWFGHKTKSVMDGVVDDQENADIASLEVPVPASQYYSAKKQG